MKNRFIKLIFKLFIVISVLECMYLLVLPAFLQKIFNKDFICSFLENNSNIILSADKLVLKTHFSPSVSLFAKNIKIKNKNTNQLLISADDTDLQINLLPLILKKISPKHFYADNLKLFILQNNDGSFNFDNLMTEKNNKSFKFQYNNVEIRSEGSINTNNSISNFEINSFFSAPFSLKNLSNNDIKGSFFLYNVNLKEFVPVLKKFSIPVKDMNGIVDFLQISAEKQDNKTTQFVINSKFNNILYNQNEWKNFIFAKNENKVSSTVNIFDNTVQIKNFHYNALNVDISSNGSIELKEKPDLNINISVKNSKTENIAALLPPTLVKETMIIEKIKTYGIYGDMECEVNIKGSVLQPDITGYVKGKNIKILDINTRKLHNGKIDINFNKRKLNMDILLEMPNGQNAKINGTTYIYRDGINDVFVKTTKNINFSLAHKLIVPISKVFYFQLGPIPDMNITSGNGNIDIHIKGSLDFVDISGVCNFNNAAITYNGLYGYITNAKGKVNFEGDNIIVTTERAFIQNNPFKIDGKVKINNNLNFNISAQKAEAKDLLEIVKKSEILKDVKKGLVLFDKAKGNTELLLNIAADIVPVPFGQFPLPPEDAFKNIKVKGTLFLNDIQCFLEGFKIPVKKISGKVNFTETLVDFSNIKAASGESSFLLNGKIITDIKTKIPDVMLEIRGNSIKAGNTIEFLTESYLYPKDYPNISSLYNLDAKHDLYLKYKAKSADFLTNNIYAVMNIEEEKDDNSIKAKSGKVIMDKGNVSIDNISADIFNSEINISGNVKKVGTINPIYNVKISSNEFNLENLNNADKINIIPVKLNEIISLFKDYKGRLNIAAEYRNNILNTKANFKDFSFIHKESSIPINFDDFLVEINNDKISADNVTADIANLPMFIDFKILDLYTNPKIEGYITTKLNNDFIKNTLPEKISNKISLSGDINISSYINGTKDNMEIKPKITLFPDADALISGAKLGDSTDKRVLNSDIIINKDEINIKNLDYYKYITTQNNTVYPSLFANGAAILKYNKKNNNYELISGFLKTEKSLSAKLLNAFLYKPFFKQGTVNCDLKYGNNKIEGELNARNIDIPFVDAVVKNVILRTDEKNINIKAFGFINDSVVRLDSIFDNDLKKVPHFDTLKIYADKIDTGKFLQSIANVSSEIDILKTGDNTLDLSLFEIEKGELHIDEITVKNYTAQNFDSNFSINKDGIFELNDIKIKLGEGSASGRALYDIKNTDIMTELDFRNIDANYMAENLFDAKNQIYGNGNANFLVKTKGNSDEELIKNLSGFAYFDITDGKMPKLGSLEYLLRASNIFKGGVTSFSINNVLEILNLVKTGYFTSINGNFKLDKGSAKDIEIYSQGENLSLYLHGDYNINNSIADMEILGKLSNKISTIFGPIGNASLNTLFKYIPGISLFDYNRKDLINNVEKIPSFTGGNYDSKTFQAIIEGDINSSRYVQSFKWVK